jgi:S-DNA-T family DNA segregation ATPase FtsK/SpoIIIE
MPLKLPFKFPGQKDNKPPRGKTVVKKPQGKVPAKGSLPPAVPPPAPAPLPPLMNLSDERKLDLLGAFMVFVGGLLLVGSLPFSATQSLSGLVWVFSLIFGWGTYLLAVVLIAIGLWLIVRKISKLPKLSLERVVGIILFFILFITILHWIAGDVEFANEIASRGEGGGYLGGLFFRMLYSSFGFAGTIVAMLAWLIISLTMTFDLTVPELMHYLAPLWRMIQRAIQVLIARARGQPGEEIKPDNAPSAIADGFSPLKGGADQPVIEPIVPPALSAALSGAPVKPISWKTPDFKDILEPPSAPAINEEFREQRARLIEETLASFGAPAQVVEINSGPSITQFGVEPLFIESRNGRTRVRVSKIVSLADDLALALAAPRIRIQAPVPGRSYVGIEVPNEEMALVSMREIVEGENYQRGKKALSFPLGKDVSGHPISGDLAAMPHLLIAGTTGSGKSVCVNSILTTFLLNNTPEDLRLVLVDPKRVELTGYNGVPHLLSPVVVEMERVIGALQWMTREMDRRYHLFAKEGCRNITDYNTKMKTTGQRKLPFLVIIIDELADLMMMAPDETERTITRLAQLARATGIHMILATQRPSVDVVTGLIKANFPARIAFAVSSNTDSRVILDQPGAERLLGRGDMLFQAPDAPAPARLQGVFVSDVEIHKLVDFWKTQAGGSAYAVPGGAIEGADLPDDSHLKQMPIWDNGKKDSGDVLFDDAVDLIRREGRASVSMLQRKLRIGYTRAARIVDTMEEKKIVGPADPTTGVREVLDYGPAAPPKES